MKKTILLFILTFTTFSCATNFFVPAVGSLPQNRRLERIKKSPNYKDGSFVNKEETTLLLENDASSDSSLPTKQEKSKDVRPSKDIEVVKTDLKNLDLTKNQMIWFGHSSYLLVLGGKTFLVDPILEKSFPSGVVLKPFDGSDFYTPDDIPTVDYLVITHDHWDHLDYTTVKALSDRTKIIVCPLGVGAHFEFWGFENFVELDWDEVYIANDSIKFTCLPTRHFSGRLLTRNQSLWASFMIETEKTVFIGGDGGYGSHFAEIGQRFKNIDLAILENGQYNLRWKNIHTMPQFFKQVILDLGAKQTVPVHNSKFALSIHAWNEPIVNAQQLALENPWLNIHVLKIGELFTLR